MAITASQYFFGPKPGARDEAAFYGSLKMRNGTFKSTRAGRFADLDPQVVRNAPQAPAEGLNILDVAVSGGMSTVELSNAFRAAGRDHRITATDLFVDARIVAMNGHVRVLADARGWPLQYDIAGRALRPWTRRLDYVTLAALPLALARSLSVRRLRARAGEGRPVRLVCRRLAELRNVSLLEQDLFTRSEALEGRYHVVRAANILNLGYFAREKLELGVRNLLGYLEGPESILVITRTDERSKTNNASIFALDAQGRPGLVQRIGDGSEIEEIVLRRDLAEMSR